ncbi:PRC-barrel domain containing protein [Altererythrobacter sp. KTW20L]|uniref:PRC-barrel domain containing protein n=1 Tax=Altererythrobacter sp. KTW20L TaxID=2942210 RepID=UPI0020BEDBB0|nr:PRC-barrel domain containing protein [Altererythrobacter sp. KTW20L]MCL6250149.1 PRC-barrel domain containing protein [Altererythrobacter sp. KTW20L]
MKTLSAIAVLPFLVLAACGSDADRQAELAEDRIESEAEASAMASGNDIAALGLTEMQLLDADLVSADGTDLGDIEQVRRDGSGAVTGLLVELEDTDPDRYVVVPLAGLITRVDGDDTDLQTAMSAADLAALPDAQLSPDPAAAPPMGAAAPQ